MVVLICAPEWASSKPVAMQGSYLGFGEYTTTPQRDKACAAVLVYVLPGSPAFLGTRPKLEWRARRATALWVSVVLQPTLPYLPSD